MTEVHVDIETRSRVDLTKTGVYAYAACPDFRILMGSWSVDGAEIYSTIGHKETSECFNDLREDADVFVAHNAQFERVCFSRGAGLPPGQYLQPRGWRDTQAIAAELGYPQSLSKAAKSLGAPPKDEAGTRLINLFCKPNRDGEFNRPEDFPEDWLDFIAYCEQDVDTLREVDRLLLEDGGWPTPMEEEVFFADQAINDRGIAIDLALAREAVKAGEANAIEQKDRIRDLTGIDNPGSRDQMMKWAWNDGLELPNLKAETVERTLLLDLTDTQREVFELRQELALAAPAKFSSALNAQVDGRLHGTLKFFGAHTGRWAGRGTQVQNLPRASFTKIDPETGKKVWDEAAESACILDVILGLGAPASDLKKVVRPLFTGPFTVVDYSAIEARVIAWLAGEEWALQAFREGRDIYVETAKQMGPSYDRAQGKIAVLALGYNGGSGSLKAMATDSDYVEINGEQVPLALAPDEVLMDMFVWPWRDTNSHIVRLWDRLQSRFRTSGDVGEHLTFEKDHGNRDRLLRLPSGRPIGYRKCGVEKRMVYNKWKDQMEEKEFLTFWSPQGYRADTYGGRIAENATQAVARDLMAAAIVRLEKEGYPVVAHVHDECIIEGEHDVDVIAEIMCELPDWAEGLPIDAEGFKCKRYRKG